MLVLVTGATGKVGQNFLPRFLSEPRWAGARIRALCHHRAIPPGDRVDVVMGSIADPETVARAMQGVTHVVHMATVKEDPRLAMDVSVKGMFWLLEAFRANPAARQFILIGGDCTVGHMFVPYDAPITETSPRRAYPGVYALSKVIEEVMLEQYQIQYGLPGCCLRAPWIMEKDDFRHAIAFGGSQFGGPPWDTLIPPDEHRRFDAENRVPLMHDADGLPLRRGFVHVSDLVEAMIAAIDHPAAHQQWFNIAMNEPVGYGIVADHLKATRGMESAPIATPFHSNWLDNAKARQRLGWSPRYDTRRLIDEAFAYTRSPDDPRKVWYPG